MQVWINSDDEKNVSSIAKALDKALTDNSKKNLKGFIIFMNPNSLSKDKMNDKLVKLYDDEKLSHVAFTFLPGPKDEAVKEYEINPKLEIKNTVFFYKNKTVQTKLINLKIDADGLKTFNTAVKKLID